MVFTVLNFRFTIPFYSESAWGSTNCIDVYPVLVNKRNVTHLFQNARPTESYSEPHIHCTVTSHIHCTVTPLKFVAGKYYIWIALLNSWAGYVKRHCSHR